MSNKKKKNKKLQAVPSLNAGTAELLQEKHISRFIQPVISIFAALLTIIFCVSPMKDYPIWNGEQPGHRNQYELMAENILSGRITFDYGDDEELSKLENPYDPAARDEAGVRFHWDHAYYKGNYYMYFGIVPVLLLFLPYRVMTGEALVTYKATQVFAAVSIIGIFALFHLCRRLFFKKMPYAACLSLCVAFSAMSIWYSSAEPALYCTAITSAIALMIWSIFFFVYAVWGETRENRQILFAGIGALLGALVFGCRPPIALANVLVLPMLVVFIRQRKFTAKVFGKLCIAAAPYVLVGISLMVYNYVRFDSPFEFGQSYQLTVADQSNYNVTLDAGTFIRLINEGESNFFGIQSIKSTFPFITPAGVFSNFPILLLSIAIFNPNVIKKAREKKLLLFTVCIIATVLIITVMDILWTPYLLERYRMDIYFLMGIACFIIVGLWLDGTSERMRKVLTAAVICLSVMTVISSFLFFLTRVNVYYPEKVIEIAERLNLDKIGTK